MTKSEWVVKIQRKLADRKYFTSDMINDAIDDMLGVVCGDVPIYFSYEPITSVAGTDKYTPTKTYIDIKNKSVFFSSENYPLDKVSYEEIRALMEDPSDATKDQSIPRIFAYENFDGVKQLIVWPAPDEAGKKIMIFGQIQRANFADDETIDLPLWMIDPAQQKILQLLNENDFAHEVANYHKNNYEAKLPHLRMMARRIRGVSFVK